jgi:hypothetical protein
VLLVDHGALEAEPQEAAKKKRLSIVQEYFETHQGEEQPSRADSVAAYERAPVVKLTEEQSLLAWWNTTSLAYGDLSKLASMLLCVPASSATCERLFSAAGRVLEDRRQNLSSESVDAILLLRSAYSSASNA